MSNDDVTADHPHLTVALLGTGTMGAGMARSIAGAGLTLRVWNRSRDKAEALADVAQVCADVAEAVDGADVLVTMLFDADSVASALEGLEGRGSGDGGLAEGAVWLQTTTVGVEGEERLRSLADRLGVAYLDAPVLGTKKPAADGALVVLASGDEAARGRVQPVLDAIGSRTLWVGEAGAGSRLKLACNAWVATVVEGISQSLKLAGALGVDPSLFLDAVSGGALDAPYVGLKGAAMLADQLDPQFQLSGGIKDLELMVAAAADSDTELVLVPAILEQWRRAADQGLGDLDLAATYKAR